MKPGATPFAQGTVVSPEKSRAELETILNRYGADSFAYASMGAQRRARVEFAAHGRRIRFDVGLPDPTEKRFTRDRQGYMRSDKSAAEAYDAEVRRLWRALVLAVKAKLEMVQSGLSIFEAEFLAHTVMPDGRTVAEHALPQIEEAYQRGHEGRPLLLLGDGR